MKPDVSDDDIRERLAEYRLALKRETMASMSVREAWKKMVAMFEELLERRTQDAAPPSQTP
ncbi:MAG: hypothetical protein JWO19_4402 [Bryobacterales bacterium]|nr:hypothetical protein [Bryobacterales bacterium]